MTLHIFLLFSEIFRRKTYQKLQELFAQKYKNCVSLNFESAKELFNFTNVSICSQLIVFWGFMIGFLQVISEDNGKVPGILDITTRLCWIFVKIFATLGQFSAFLFQCIQRKCIKKLPWTILLFKCYWISWQLFLNP